MSELVYVKYDIDDLLRHNELRCLGNMSGVTALQRLSRKWAAGAAKKNPARGLAPCRTGGK